MTKAPKPKPSQTHITGKVTSSGLDVTRRGLLGGLTAAATASGLNACAPDAPKSFTAKSEMITGTFSHGIASGDPTSTQIILWTRITPENSAGGPIDVIWEMALDAEFTTEIISGTTQTQASRHWTVKVDVTELKPGTSYFYRFKSGDKISPTGHTKTLPTGALDKARFAVVSCANWQHGFFNVYDYIARKSHFDALLHLGDYIYEYGAENALDHPAGRQGRLHEPRHEIITLDDYRTRHAQYRTDIALQSVTAKMPLISIWDDHETSNDSWTSGAENHNEGEGGWPERKAAALRAYYEWMPIREPRIGRVKEDIFRSYDYGDLLTLVTLETRLMARSEPLIFENDTRVIHDNPEAYKANILNAPEREMIGQAQTDFIIDTLTASKAKGIKWRLLANQVIMGRVLTTDLTPYIDETSIDNLAKDWPGVRDVVGLSKYNLPVYPDSWDGYPVARENFYTRLKSANIEDIIVITGDSHEFWVNDLTTQAGDKMGVELGATSISSETLVKYMGANTADYNLLVTQSNPDVRYYNALHNGFIDLEITPGQAAAKFIGLDTVLSKDYTIFDVAAFDIKPDKRSLKVTNPQGLNLKQRALFSGLG